MPVLGSAVTRPTPECHDALDTGRLPQETYDLMGQVRRRYAIEIEVDFPNAERVEAMVRAKGLNLFYESIENRSECCGVRKVEPFGRAVATLDGWVTGLRGDQIVTRVEIAKIAPTRVIPASGRSPRSPTGRATGSGPHPRARPAV